MGYEIHRKHRVIMGDGEVMGFEDYQDAEDYAEDMEAIGERVSSVEHDDGPEC